MRRPPICSHPSMRLCAWSTPSPGRSPRSSPWIGRGAEEHRVDGEAGEDCSRLPIVHSTVNVSSGPSKPTAPELADLLEESPPIEPLATRGRTPTSSPPCAPRADASSSCARSGQRCVSPVSVFLAKGYNRISQVACRAHSERISTSDKLREEDVFRHLSTGFESIFIAVLDPTVKKTLTGRTDLAREASPWLV